MGGVAGHLSHLYDNRDLTFNEMKKILSLASSGDLVGTEKTDGYNIYLGFKDSAPRYARNKGDMKAGGRSTEDLAARVFAGGEGVKKVYNDAFRAFQKAAQSLTPAEQGSIFGQDGEIFYNTEIQGPGASNLVNYDANVLSIHRGGHKMYDPTEDKVISIDAVENSIALDKVIDRFESATSEEPFSVRRTALLQLQKLDDDYDLQIALAKIKKAGFQGSMTIEQYLENNLLNDINSKLPYFSGELKQVVVDRVLKKENAQSLTAIYKGFPKDQKEAVRNFVNDGDKYIKQAILPIEEAIHDFAVELLKGLHSSYILDNESEVGRIKDEVVNAIKTIQSYEGEHSELAQDVLAQQLRKIKHVENINTAVEGFVFQHGDQLYKFTGNFAPVNQLLGLFKYGRGVIPPFEKAEIQEQGGDLTPENTARRKIAVIPGKFKPPHRGHLDMVMHYADIVDLVVILISPIPRKTSGGIEITRDKSKQIWQTYLSSVGLDSNRVIITDSPYNSPVQTSYELVAGNVPGFKPVPGDLIIPGASTKADPKSGLPDTTRFKKFHIIPRSERGAGVLTADVEDYAFTPSGMEGVAFSASDFREAIDEGDINSLNKFIPQEVGAELVLDIIYDGEVPEQKKTLTMDSLYSLVEELMIEKLEVYKEELDTPTERYRRGAHNEEVELDEGLEDLLKKAGEMARVTLARVRGDGADVRALAKTLGMEYLDPAKDAQKIIDTAEVLKDIRDYGRREVLKDPRDAKLFKDWLLARTQAKVQKRKKKVNWEKTAFLEEVELDEMSSMAGGAVAGATGNKKKRKNSLIREE